MSIPQHTINLSLVFDDVRRYGKSVYSSAEYIEKYAASNIHGGSTFPGTITLDPETADEFIELLRDGYRLVFWVLLK